MITSTIRHGDLVIDVETNGSVRLTRQTTMESIQLSVTEWGYLCKVSELFGWPVLSPTQQADITNRAIEDAHAIAKTV